LEQQDDNNDGKTFEDDGIDWHDFILVQTIDLFETEQAVQETETQEENQ
jgi:hypothetical protein